MEVIQTLSTEISDSVVCFLYSGRYHLLVYFGQNIFHQIRQPTFFLPIFWTFRPNFEGTNFLLAPPPFMSDMYATYPVG